MSLKGLSSFNKVDIDGFLRDKVLVVTNCSVWTDYETKAKLGTKVETVITVDETVYPTKDGSAISNCFEKLVFKVPKNITVPANTEVKPINPVGTIYGQYRNQLSIKCDGIQAVNRQPKQ